MEFNFPNYFNLLQVRRFFNNGAFKGSLLGLRPFLAVESPLKMMKNANNAFHFTLTR